MIRFLNPNYHVILIHYPLGLLGAGLLIEILSFLWRTSSVRIAAHWMILIGALACVPAATTGIFAKFDILSNGGGGNWLDIRQAAGLSAEQWHLLNRHVLLASLGAGIAALGAMVWLATAIQWPGHLSLPMLAVFLIAMGLMVASAYNAGEAVYRTQFATRSEDQSNKLLAQWQDDGKSAGTKEKWQRRIEFYIDTLQLHVLAAGIVFALAAAGIGVSWRKSSLLNRKPLPKLQNAEAEPPPLPPELPVCRLWMAAALAAFGTLGLGWYVTGYDLPVPLWNVSSIFHTEIWDGFRKDPREDSRMFAHFALGSAIVLLSAMLIIATRWAARRKLVIALLSLLLLTAIGSQIGVGILLLYDGDSGPIAHFNAASSPADQNN